MTKKPWPNSNDDSASALDRPRGVRSPSSRDLARWNLRQRGLSVEEIAARDRVSVRTVEDSIARVELWRTANSLELLQAGEIELLNRTRALRQKLIEESYVNPEEIKIPEVQLRVLAEQHHMIEALVRAAGAKMQQAVQVNIGGPEVHLHERSFEARLRRILSAETGLSDDSTDREESAGTD
jgi:predicted DNA-binding protein YlxM (UPF0122 family)